jgi:capsular polysaccharide biosynthesis protein
MLEGGGAGPERKGNLVLPLRMLRGLLSMAFALVPPRPPLVPLVFGSIPPLVEVMTEPRLEWRWETWEVVTPV